MQHLGMRWSMSQGYGYERTSMPLASLWFHVKWGLLWQMFDEFQDDLFPPNRVGLPRF